MPVTEVFAAIFVSDYGASREWYERLVGRAPDLIPNDHEAAWQLTASGWVYIEGDAGRAGSSRVTLLVDDLDERVAELARRGIDAETIEELPGLVRRTEVADPDGNTIQLAQPPGRA